eukprot:5025428-Pyramimonas_sp.AAC.1
MSAQQVCAVARCLLKNTRRGRRPRSARFRWVRAAKDRVRRWTWAPRLHPTRGRRMGCPTRR